MEERMTSHFAFWVIVTAAMFLAISPREPSSFKALLGYAGLAVTGSYLLWTIVEVFT
jgi:hypothetical protein